MLKSLYQNKYGKWIAVADLGVDNNGKRIRKQVYYGDSEEKANQAIASAYKKKKSLVKDAFTTKFCDVMKRWLLYNKKQTVKSRTFETIMLNYNNHIEPKLKNLDMQDVDITVLQNLLRGIKSKEPRRKVKYLLNQFMDYCVVQKYIELHDACMKRFAFLEGETGKFDGNAAYCVYTGMHTGSKLVIKKYQVEITHN